jgi:hypothetical protein
MAEAGGCAGAVVGSAIGSAELAVERRAFAAHRRARAGSGQGETGKAEPDQQDEKLAGHRGTWSVAQEEPPCKSLGHNVRPAGWPVHGERPQRKGAAFLRLRDSAQILAARSGFILGGQKLATARGKAKTPRSFPGRPVLDREGRAPSSEPPVGRRESRPPSSNRLVRTGRIALPLYDGTFWTGRTALPPPDGSPEGGKTALPLLTRRLGPGGWRSRLRTSR